MCDLTDLRQPRHGTLGHHRLNFQFVLVAYSQCVTVAGLRPRPLQGGVHHATIEETGFRR